AAPWSASSPRSAPTWRTSGTTTPTRRDRAPRPRATVRQLCGGYRLRPTRRPASPRPRLPPRPRRRRRPRPRAVFVTVGPGRELAEVVADAKYGTTANYAFLETAGIAASIPPHANKSTYRAVTSDAFTYDEAHDQYRCPAGQILRRQGKSATAGAMGGIIYR